MQNTLNGFNSTLSDILNNQLSSKNIRSKSFTAFSDWEFTDLLDLSLTPGIYGVLPTHTNNPNGQYGFMFVVCNSNSTWNYRIYIGTNREYMSINYYNTFDSSPHWYGWCGNLLFMNNIAEGGARYTGITNSIPDNTEITSLSLPSGSYSAGPNVRNSPFSTYIIVTIKTNYPLGSNQWRYLEVFDCDNADRIAYNFFDGGSWRGWVYRSLTTTKPS